MNKAQISLNRCINLLKWPVAVLLLASLPWFGQALGRAAWALLQKRDICLALAGGGLVYWVLYHWVWRKGTSLEWFFTLQHEVEHAIFAVLSLNSLRDLRIESGKGGHVSYAGQSNWLISIAPYWMPSFPLLVAAWIAATNRAPGWLAVSVLGFTTALHIHATLRETHGDQTDLHNVGKSFAWCFLPAAHALCALFIIGTAINSHRHWFAAVKEIKRVVIGFV